MPLRGWGGRYGSCFGQCKRERHRGPTGTRSRHPLIVAMRETAIEVWLEAKRTGLCVPGAIFLLASEQELDAALVGRIGDGQPADLERDQTLSGGVSRALCGGKV